MDPKLEADGVSLSDMKEQQELQFKVIDLLSDARKLQDKVESKIKELEESNASEATLKPYKDALKQLKMMKVPIQKLLWCRRFHTCTIS